MKDSVVLRKPDSLRNHVENFLRDAIMTGRFKPGERLVERELCELLDVSRPSLREALRKLEAEKLITTVLHRGPVVASIKPSEARDLFAVRAMMEAYAAQEFTRLANDETIRLFERAVRNLHKAAERSDREQLLVAKSELYDVMLDTCGNQLIKEILVGLFSRIHLLRATSFSRPDRLSESLREIDHLLKCIKSRDADAAYEAARVHVIKAEQAALAMLEQQELEAVEAAEGVRVV